MEFTGEFFVPTDRSSGIEIEIEHKQRYLSIAKLTENRIIIDIASGEGYGAEIISHNAKEVIGLDINPDLVEHATSKYKKANLSFKQGSCDNMPIGDSYADVVVSFETLEHVDKETQKLFMREIKRVLKKDGTLIISTPNKKNYSERYNYVNKFHAHELVKDEFLELLESKFSYINLYEQGFEVVSLLHNRRSYKIHDKVKVILNNTENYNFEGKYFLAVCSDNFNSTESDISSIVPEAPKTYLSLVDNILKLQREVEELGSWGKKLDKMLAENSTAREELNSKLIQCKDEHTKEIQSWEEDAEVQKKQWLEKENMFLNERAAFLKFISESESSLANLEAQKAQEIQALQDDLLHAKSTLAESQLVIAAKEKETKSLRDLLSAKESLLQGSESKNTQKAEEIETLQNVLSEARSLLNKKDLEISSKENEIKKQQTLLSELRAALKHKWEENAELFNKISSLEERNKSFHFDKSSKLEKLLKENEGKSNELNRLRAEKKDIEVELNEVYSSQGYKFLSIYYRLKGKLLPYNSKRYNQVKSIYYFIRRKGVPPSLPAVTQPTKIIVPAPVNYEKKANQPLIFKESSSPLVSIIIPVYNNWEYTSQCLQSIYDHTTDIPIEIIIADDGSVDETTNLSDHFTNVRHIKNEKNLGYIRNINNAARQANGEYILTLNNDTTVTPGWLSSMLAVMEKDPSVALVGSKLVYPDGQLQEAGAIIWRDASGWNYGHGGSPDAPEYNYLKEVDYISGASHLIRMSSWKELGGLDERYSPAYYDDSDFSFQLRSLGWKVIYQPLSVVIHYEGKSHGTSLDAGIKKYQARNQQIFREKWAAELQKHFPNAEHVFWARDRSYGKKSIVFIDHYVPHFDKDAGSRFTFRMLELLTSLGYNVKFIGDNYFRHEPYTTMLEQMGIEVLCGSWYQSNWQEWVVRNKDYIDVFYLNRPHISSKYIDFIKENTNAKVVYFGHDLHFLRAQRQYEIEKKHTLLESIEEWKEIEGALIQKADKVVTLSSVEKEVIEQTFKISNVHIIPSLFYKEFNSPILNFEARKDIFFVGGFNHQPNVDGVLWFCEEILPIVREKHPSIRFIIAGSKRTEVIENLACEHIKVHFDVSDDQLQQLYNAARIVVLPLRYGAGVKGKTIEAIYHGIPFIATNIALEGIEHIETVAKGEDDALTFAGRIIELYDDFSKLLDMSKNLINFSAQQFSEKKAAAMVNEVFTPVSEN